jgi:hydroxyacylglutathione hydrolase
MVDAHGHASEVLFNLGPGRLGTVIETIAIPEIRQQACEIAGLIATRIAKTAQSRPSLQTPGTVLLKGTALAVP